MYNNSKLSYWVCNLGYKHLQFVTTQLQLFEEKTII